MSINSYVDNVEDAAQSAALKSGAVVSCEFHPDVMIRVGDDDAERHAYALATNMVKADQGLDRKDVIEAVNDFLGQCADDECPACAYLAHS